MAENINDIGGKVSLDITDYKANVSELNRQIRVIESGFQAAAAGMDNWGRNIDGLQARISSLNQVTDIQRQKISALREQYEAIAAAKGADSKAAQDLEIRINKEQQALNANEKELRRCQAALDDFGKETEGTTKKADGFASKLSEIGPKLAQIGGEVGKAAAATIAAVGASIAAASVAAFKLATDAGKAADNLLTLSAKTGIAVEQLQEMEYAARFVDVPLETMTGSLAKLTKSMDNNNEAFGKLGVSVRDSNGQLRDSKVVWEEAIGALGNVANETERDALAMQIFGKSAMELNPLIKAGSDEMARLAEEARNLGVVLSEDSVKAAGRFDDVMQRFQATTKALATNIGIAVMPAVESVVGAVGSIVPKIIEAVQTGNWDEAGTALSDGIGDLIDKAVEVLPGIAEAAGKIITTLVEAIAKAIPGVLPLLVQTTVDVVKSLADTLIDNAPLIVKAVVDGVKAAILGVMDILPKILDLGQTLLAELVKGVAEALPELIPAAVKMVDTLIGVIFENAPMMVDAGIQLTMGLIDGVVRAVPNIVEALIKFIPAFIDSWIRVLTTLIEALPKAIILIVAALPRLISGIIEGLMKALPQIVQAGVDLFVALVHALPEIIKQIVMIIPQIITSIIDTLTKSLPLIIQAGIQLFVALVKAAPTIIIEIVKAIPAIVSAIANGFLQGIGQMIQAGRDLIGGVWQGIEDSGNWLWEQVKGFFSNLLAKIKSFLGISSPSSVMADLVGKNMGLGIAEGFKGSMSAASAMMEMALNNAVTGMKGRVSLDVTGNASAQAGTPAPTSSGSVTNVNYVFNSPKALGMREMLEQMRLSEQRLALMEG